MPGALNSGRNVIFELTDTSFHDLVLNGLRRDEGRTCVDGESVWVQQVDVRELGFSWIEQRSASEMPQRVPPILVVPYDIDEVRARFPTDFSFLQTLLGTVPSVTSVSVRAATQAAGAPAPLAVAAGYELSIGSPKLDVEWEAFLENFLPPGADWGVAIDPTIVQQMLDGAFATMAGTPIEINQQTDDFFLERFMIETISGSYGDPIQIHVRGTVVKSGPDVDVEFDLTGVFQIVSGNLLLLLTMVPDSMAVDTWDGVQTVFSDPWVIAAAIVGGITGLGIGGPAIVSSGLHAAIMAAIRFGGTSTAPSFTTPPVGLGPVVFQPAGGPQFVGTTVAQLPIGLLITGIAPQPHLIAPFLTLSGNLEYIESHASACAGGPPDFPAKDLVFRNDGEYLLFICRIEGPANADFQVLQGLGAPVMIPPGEGRGMRIRYVGQRGANAADTIRVTCNDPRRMIRSIPLLARAGGQAAYSVDPSPVVEVLVANSATGRPVARMGRCRVFSDPGRAAEFTVRSTGDGVLFLCDGVLEDPDDVFVVSYAEETLTRHQARTYPILFYPKAVMHDYYATFRIQSNAGEIVVPLHGRVEALPAMMEGGMVAFLPTDEICVPPDALCELEPMFERNPGGGALPVRVSTFFDVPPGAEMVVSDGAGTALVRDYSRRTSRTHALAYGGDGPDGPRLACVPDFPGIGPGDRELVRVRVSEWLVRPVEKFAEADGATSIVAGEGWAFLGTKSGIDIVDWREPGNPKLSSQMRTGPVSGLAMTGQTLFVATGDEILEIGVKRPDRPERRSVARRASPVAALAATRGMLFALDRTSVTVFHLGSGDLSKSTSQPLPEGVTQIGAFGKGLYAAGGKTLVAYGLEADGGLQLIDRIALEKEVETLTHFGRDILVSGDFGARAYSLAGKEFTATKDFRHRHWSVGFSPDLEHKRLFRLEPAGAVSLWQLGRRRLDRARFEKSLKLRFRPERPK